MHIIMYHDTLHDSEYLREKLVLLAKNVLHSLYITIYDVDKRVVKKGQDLVNFG